jgi:hypothetical protein
MIFLNVDKKLFVAGLYEPLQSLEDTVFILPVTNVYGFGGVCGARGSLELTINDFWGSNFTNDGWGAGRLRKLYCNKNGNHGLNAIFSGYRKWEEESELPNSIELFLERIKKTDLVMPFWEMVCGAIRNRQDGGRYSGFNRLMQSRPTKEQMIAFLSYHRRLFKFKWSATKPTTSVQGL